MSDTKIKQCTCSHAFQDSKYGQGNRVHNRAKGSGDKAKWRCTACGKERD